MARPVHLPAREPAALELRRLAVRAAVSGRSTRSSGRARLEPVPAADLPRGGGFAYLWLRELALPVAAALRSAGSSSRSSRTASRRARATCGARSRRSCRSRSGRFERGRRGSALVATSARRRRSPRSRSPTSTWRSARFRSSCSTRSAAAPARRGALATVAGPGRGAPRRALLDERDRLRRPLAARGGALLGDRARLRHAPPAARARELRLPRLADAAARARRAGVARARAALVARRGAGGRRARADRCSRSGRTSRSTRPSGTTCRRCATRASRSG